MRLFGFKVREQMLVLGDNIVVEVHVLEQFDDGRDVVFGALESRLDKRVLDLVELEQKTRIARPPLILYQRREAVEFPYIVLDRGLCERFECLL